MDQNWCKHRNIYVWALTKIIFNYTGSPGEKKRKKEREKVPQKSFMGLLFDSHCIYAINVRESPKFSRHVGNRGRGTGW